MNNLAQIILDGNLTVDPECRKTSKGKTVTNIRIATNHEWGESQNRKKGVSFFLIECWGTLAENCDKYLTKGSKITAQGELREDRWKDKAGKTHSRIKVVAHSVRFDATKKKEETVVDEEEEDKQELKVEEAA